MLAPEKVSVFVHLSYIFSISTERIGIIMTEFQPPARPHPTQDEYSVWADDRGEALKEKIVESHWLCEFAGSRADCLRYLDAALISDDSGFRVWGFAVYPPGTSPHHENDS